MLDCFSYTYNENNIIIFVICPTSTFKFLKKALVYLRSQCYSIISHEYDSHSDTAYTNTHDAHSDNEQTNTHDAHSDAAYTITNEYIVIMHTLLLMNTLILMNIQ